MEPTISEQEWIARALQAAADGQAQAGRELLQQCLQHHPHSAAGHYLMAVECAESREPEQALGHFAAALQAEPLLHEARLQCGLLLLTLGRDAQAAAVLAGFDGKALHPAMQAYQEGLRLLAAGQATAALERLQVGLSLRHPNEPLRGDMQRLAQHLSERLRAMVAAGAPAPVADPSAATGADTPVAPPETHYLFNAYRPPRHDA